MKRSVFAVFLLLCAIACSGCTAHELPDFSSTSYGSSEDALLPTDFVYDPGSEVMPAQFRHMLTEMDGYLYYDDGTSLVRLNSETGARSYLCADPLCKHNTGCEYDRSSMRAICTGDGKLFFWREFDNNEVSLVMYDTKTAKQTVVCPWEGEGGQIPVFTYDAPYVYYYVVVAKEMPGYEIGDVLMRQVDTRTMENRVLYAFPEGRYGYCAGRYQDDAIVMTTNQITRLSMTNGAESVLLTADDLHGTTIYANSYCLMGDVLRFFSTDRTEPQAPKTYFWEYHLEHNMLTEIACAEGEINNASFCYTQDALYFRRSETYRLGTFVAKNSANSGEMTLRYPNFYRLNYDTAEIEPVLLQLPAEYETCNLMHEFVVHGHYIYVQYNHNGSPQADGVYYEADFSGGLSGLMRIDIRDGSLSYVGGK